LVSNWLDFGQFPFMVTDELRSRLRRSKIFLAPETGENIGEALMERESELMSVQAAMSRLPEGQRPAVSLALVEGLPYKEAAEVLEIPIGTLTSRLARGREARQALLMAATGRVAMTISAETLMSYVDRRLDRGARDEVERALRTEP
jgi:RNA polymerase sigma-70 factor (ECF subfamily)